MQKKEEKTALHVAVEKNNLGSLTLLLNKDDLDINNISISC